MICDEGTVGGGKGQTGQLVVVVDILLTAGLLAHTIVSKYYTYAQKEHSFPGI